MFDAGDVAYASQRLASFRGQFDFGRFMADCESAGLDVLYRNAAELETLTLSIVEKIRARESFSLIRIGDGEGNILSLSLPGSDQRRDLKWANAIFQLEDGRTVEIDEAAALSADMLRAMRSANVLGTRLLRPYDEGGSWNELDSSARALEMNEIRGCVGMVDAVETLQRLVASGELMGRTLTSAWIYLHLLADLGRFIQDADRVIVISGRPALRQVFEARCRGKSLQFIDIPVEAIGGRRRTQPSHYPEHYNRVLSFLRQSSDIRGSLVLVGAGFFGKVYCGVAKEAGAVAIDMGSAFDLLVGLKSRPIHERLLREMQQRSVDAGKGTSVG